MRRGAGKGLSVLPTRQWEDDSCMEDFSLSLGPRGRSRPSIVCMASEGDILVLPSLLRPPLLLLLLLRLVKPVLLAPAAVVLMCSGVRTRLEAVLLPVLLL
jgi:hypothetical protein